jgi:hypothetical protein
MRGQLAPDQGRGTINQFDGPFYYIGMIGDGRGKCGISRLFCGFFRQNAAVRQFVFRMF